MSIANAIVHPTAIVEDGAHIGAGVHIGPYCTVGSQARIGDGARLQSHVVVAGRTTIGPRTQVYPFASLGHAPQDLKYRGEDTALIIGADNKIREHVTMNPGTEGGGGETVVGDGGLFMAGCHVAHDCRIGNGVILANNAACAGHVTLGDGAILGGLCGLHQFVRVGAYAMVGGMAGVEKDVIPYGSVIGNRAALGGLNLVGMKRRGFDRETIHAARAAYRIIFEGEGDFADRIAAAVAAYPEVEPVKEMADFLAAGGSRGFCTPRDA